MRWLFSLALTGPTACFSRSIHIMQGRFELIRIWLGAVLALAATVALAAQAPQAFAAAEVHKLNLVLSAMPSQVNTGDFNDAIERFNRLRLESQGLEGLAKINFAWQFDAQLHYFVRSNVAVNLGVGQLRTQSKREFLPAILQDVTIRAELMSVPVHVGLDYYFTPYNQGDFQARAYLGGGFLDLVGNKALVEQVDTNPDSVTTAKFGPSFRSTIVRDSPGYFVEGGVHMFFASHFSVMLGLLYRSAQINNMLDQQTGQPVYRFPDGKPFQLDVGGASARMGLAYGF
jgi:hypothetical protein